MRWRGWLTSRSGLALTAALAPLDLKALTGSQVVDVLKARYRQNNHERAQLLAVADEVMLRSEAEWEVPGDRWPGELGADEVRAALVFSRSAAEKLCMFAEDVVRRLPEVQQAFVTGVLDQARVWVFSSWTRCLSDEHTRAIVAALLPKAPQLTTAQLIHEMQRHAIALDPNWARKRYEQALKGRRVVGSRNSDGTANLAGYDLPMDQVAAAAARLDRLAKAAKQAGHPDPIDHVRSYLFLGMTDGSYEGLTDPQILARLLADANLTQPAPAEPANDSPDGDLATDDAPAHDGSGADERPADESSTEDRSADPCADEPTFADAAGPAGRASNSDGTDGEDDSGNSDGTDGKDDSGNSDGTDGKDDSGPGDDDPGHADGGPGPGDGGPGPGDGGPDRGGAVGRTSGLRLLVRLATLAGADQRPADVIGWGAVHAALARTMAAAPGASWWSVLTDPGGAPLAVGPVRSRPHGRAAGGRGYPGLQVWLQVNQATLDALARQEHPPGWDRVIAEITAKADCNTGPPNGDPTARLPGAELRRWIHVRDRTCVFPGCRVPAHRADADHSVEHINGGETTDTNLGAACRHDHRLRHEGGWTLEQTSPGQFTWTSRLGHTYHRTPPPELDDLPEPMPGSAKDDDAAEFDQPSTEDWRNSTCMEPERPQRPAPPPPAPPPTQPEDDIPPF